MAFDKNQFTVGFGVASGAPTVFSTRVQDTATIYSADGYFDDVAYTLSEGDLIMVYSDIPHSEYHAWLYVSNANKPVKTTKIIGA